MYIGKTGSIISTETQVVSHKNNLIELNISPGFFSWNIIPVSSIIYPRYPQGLWRNWDRNLTTPPVQPNFLQLKKEKKKIILNSLLIYIYIYIYKVEGEAITNLSHIRKVTIFWQNKFVGPRMDHSAGTKFALKLKLRDQQYIFFYLIFQSYRENKLLEFVTL